MRYILILILILTTIFAENKTQKITLGLGAYTKSQPYYNVDPILVPTPVIFFDNSIFYVRWTRVGIYFLGKKEGNYAWAFSLTLQPRPYGYLSLDIEMMDERETSWEGGLAFSAKKNNSWIEIMALTDIIDRHDTFVVKTEIGHDIEFQTFSLYPSLIAEYQSSSFMNYYYGVRSDEIITNKREKYTPNFGLQLGIQTYIKYPIAKNLSTLLNITLDHISKEATNSPIVEKSYFYSGLASIIYTFKY